MDLSNRKWLLFWFIIGLWIIGGIGLGIYTYNIEPPKGSSIIIETAKLVFLWFGGLGIVLPTYLNIWQSIENNKKIEEERHQQRIENSFQLTRQWDHPSLTKARDFTREIKKNRHQLSPKELVDKIENDEDLKRSLVMVFNFIDQIRISIERERVIPEMVKDSLDFVLIDIIDRFQPWIKELPEPVKRDIKKAKKLLEK